MQLPDVKIPLEVVSWIDCWILIFPQFSLSAALVGCLGDIQAQTLQPKFINIL
jgi:hypothetical protein